MIPVGIQGLASAAPKYVFPNTNINSANLPSATFAFVPPDSLFRMPRKDEEILNIREDDLESLYIQSLGVEVLQQDTHGRTDSDQAVQNGNNFSATQEVNGIPKTDQSGVQQSAGAPTLKPPPTSPPPLESPAEKKLGGTEASVAPVICLATSLNADHLKPLSKSKPISVRHNHSYQKPLNW